MSGKSKKVYAVTCGEYSDYHICGIYSTKAKAKVSLRSSGDQWGSKPRVDEWDIDKPIPRGMVPYTVYMNYEDGKDAHAYREYVPFEAEPARTFPRDVLHGVPGPRLGWTWQGWARNEKHAIKIANKQRLKALATTGP